MIAPDGVVGHVIELVARRCARFACSPIPSRRSRCARSSIPVTGIAQGHDGQSTSSPSPTSTRTPTCKTATTWSRPTSRTACTRPISRSARSRASTSSRPGSGSSCSIKPYVDFDALEFVMVLRWVPGRGTGRDDRDDHHDATDDLDLDVDARRPRPRRPTSGSLMRIGRVALLLVVTVVAAGRALPAPAHRGRVPDLGLVLAVAVAFDHGPEAGAIVGFLAGLGFDLFLVDAARSHRARVRAHRLRGRRAAGRHAASAAVVHAGDRGPGRARGRACCSSASACWPASTVCTGTRRSSTVGDRRDLRRAARARSCSSSSRRRAARPPRTARQDRVRR